MIGKYEYERLCEKYNVKMKLTVDYWGNLIYDQVHATELKNIEYFEAWENEQKKDWQDCRKLEKGIY